MKCNTERTISNLKYRTLEERLVSDRVKETGSNLKEKIKKIESSISRLDHKKTFGADEFSLLGINLCRQKSRIEPQVKTLYNTEKEIIKKLDYYDKMFVFPESDQCYEIGESAIKFVNTSSKLKISTEIKQFLNKRKSQDIQKDCANSPIDRKQFSKQLILSLNNLDLKVNGGKQKIESEENQLHYLKRLENLKIEKSHERKRAELEESLRKEMSKLNAHTLHINNITKFYSEIKSELDAQLILISNLKSDELNFLEHYNNKLLAKDSRPTDSSRSHEKNSKQKNLGDIDRAIPSKRNRAAFNINLVEQEENLIFQKQILSSRINYKEEEIKVLKRELYLKDYVRQSLKADYIKIECNLKSIKHELNEVKDLLFLHYHKLLFSGKDTRGEGLVWIIKSIWMLSKDVLMSYIPSFLDCQIVKYIFQIAHKEIELYHANELMKEIKEIILYNRGISLRLHSNVKRFEHEEVLSKSKSLLIKIQKMKESYPETSQFTGRVNQTVIPDINYTRGIKYNQLTGTRDGQRRKSVIKTNLSSAFHNIDQIQYLETNFTSNIDLPMKRESRSTTLTLTNTIANEEGATKIISKPLEKQLQKIEEETLINPYLNITKENVIEYLENKDILDEDTKFLLDYVKMLEKLRMSIKQDLKEMKSEEVKRVASEFYFNNYEKQYGATLDQIVSVIVGEDNKDEYLRNIEKDRKEYKEKKRMIQYLNPFGINSK